MNKDPKLSIGENRYMYLISLALSQHSDLKEVLATFYYIDARGGGGGSEYQGFPLSLFSTGPPG